jgi:hypothetical protein
MQMRRSWACGLSSKACWALLLASCAAEPEPATRAAGTAAALQVSRTVDAIGDTYVRCGSPNQNQGSEPIIRLQSSGKNRALLFFDPAAIHAAVAGGALSSATLEHAIDDAASNWGATGRPRRGDPVNAVVDRRTSQKIRSFVIG